MIDVRAVFQQGHREIDLGDMPPALLPRKGPLGLIDHEKMFCPDPRPGPTSSTMRGIDRARGCVVIVRPDQYVAHVLPLNAHEDIAAFFEPILVAPAIAYP